MSQCKRRARFVAIGVGQGDAFFLDTGGDTILVDGGRSINRFPVQFKKATEQNNVDILVCTHNDADHAGGVLGFLRGGLTCREVWLPGSWTDRLEDLLLHPGDFTPELVSNIEQTKVPHGRRLSLRDLWDRYRESMMNRESNSDATSAKIMGRDDLLEAMKKVTRTEDNTEMFWPYLLSWSLKDRFSLTLEFGTRFRQNYNGFSIFVEALTAAAFIREIALAAYHMGASIRWFEYDSVENSGEIPNCLVPLNAREVFRMPVGRWSALQFLALTTSNRRSLVFLSPADDEKPAVLFTADSDLAFSQPIPWTSGMIVTAPHHGAEANKNAYERFARESGEDDVIWVRSDGRFKARPGRSYLNAKGSRFCTLCRGSNAPKQDVRLILDSKRWRTPVFTRRCWCV
jgi:hypothetical protein